METTAEGCVWDGRESRQDGPGARTKLLHGSCQQQGTRAWDLDPVTNRSAARRARGGLLVGGLDFRVRSRQEAHGPGERLQQPLEALATSGAGWVGRVVFVFHAIAISFDNECLPVMHQPVDQGCGQGVVHVKEGAPFPEGSIRGQHDRSGFITGSNHLVMWCTT